MLVAKANAPGDVHIHVKQTDKTNQPVGGESGVSEVYQFGNIGLFEPEAFRGLRLRKAQRIDALADLAGEFGLQLPR